MPAPDLLADLARLPGSSRTIGGTVVERSLTPSRFSRALFRRMPEIYPTLIYAVEPQPFTDWLEGIGLANQLTTTFATNSSFLTGTSSVTEIVTNYSTGIFSATVPPLGSFSTMLSTSHMEPPNILATSVSVPLSGIGASLEVFTPMSVLRRSALSILSQGEHEDIDFGAVSMFSRGVSSFIAREGVRAVYALIETLRAKPPSFTVLGELLRELGRLPHKPSHDLRKKLLLQYLQSSSVLVRHVAATGLAELDDPSAISALEDAYRQVDSGRLKRHIMRVLQQLRGTAGCLAS